MTSSVTRWIQDANLFTSDVCKPQWLYIYRRLVLWAFIKSQLSSICSTLEILCHKHVTFYPWAIQLVQWQ